ncbi:MAG: NAD-dependent epimerase/dehydratase family protein [Actinomycetota bacterium]
MRVLIAGVDGYLGWPLAMHLARRGHQVGGVDAYLRRGWVSEIGSHSAVPIADMPTRRSAFQEHLGAELTFFEGDLRDVSFVRGLLEDFGPDAIVHLGECPSAPYSMVDLDHAVFVQTNNLVTTFNLIFAIRDRGEDTHLVKLGTMGEYGTPSVDIPEGFFEVEYRERIDRLPFPRQAGSWYHWSKVHGSNNLMFACNVYGLRATDVMQGVVFGTRVDEAGDDPRLATRVDFDQFFGTAVNRFCCQAVIGHPLTPFGKGFQKRGFLPLADSMQCLTLALENRPEPGEYRVLNQFAEVYDVTELAQRVAKVGAELGLQGEVANVTNPRMEAEEHYYNPDHGRLFELGYRPTEDLEGVLASMLEDLLPHRARIEAKRSLLLPDQHWDGAKSPVHYLDP